jgi:peptidoglycan/LPS O-acetylase OafA/YrhL
MSQKYAGQDAGDSSHDNETDVSVNPRLDALDGLRGVGALCIVLYHFFSGFTPTADRVLASGYPVYAPEFTSVVTVFFVVSGFTLTCVNSERPPPVRAFLSKRIARLAPVYYASLLPALPSFYVYTTAVAQQAFVASTTLLWLQSLIVPNEGWNTPLWQASAFAFTYPFFLPALARMKTWTTRTLRTSLIVFMVVNVIVVASTAMLLPRMHVNVGVLHRWAPFRLPQFFSGIAAGLLAQRGDITHPTVKADVITAALATSALVLCPLAVHYHPMLPAIGIDTWDAYDTWAEYLWTPVHALWLMALTSPACGGFTKRVFASAPFRFLGEISYSLYCFHAPVLFLAAWAVAGKGVNAAALPLVQDPATGIIGYFFFPPWAILPLLVVIIIVAIAVYYSIERPSRQLLNGDACTWAAGCCCRRAARLNTEGAASEPLAPRGNAAASSQDACSVSGGHIDQQRPSHQW